MQDKHIDAILDSFDEDLANNEPNAWLKLKEDLQKNITTEQLAILERLLEKQKIEEGEAYYRYVRVEDIEAEITSFVAAKVIALLSQIENEGTDEVKVSQPSPELGEKLTKGGDV